MDMPTIIIMQIASRMPMLQPAATIVANTAHVTPMMLTKASTEMIQFIVAINRTPNASPKEMITP